MQAATTTQICGRTAPRARTGRGGGRTPRDGFLTNNILWIAQTIAELYRCHWQIELFFKELKQTLQLADFLGHYANAMRWQVCTALLVYLLLRFCAFLSQ